MKVKSIEEDFKKYYYESTYSKSFAGKCFSRKKIISKIGNGLLVFVAFCDEDNLSDITWSIRKIINLRIFSDNLKK